MIALVLPGRANAYDYFENSFDDTSKSILSLGLVTTLATAPYDAQIREDWKENQLLSKPATHVGDLLGSGVPGALFALGQYYYDRENGIDHIQSIVGTSVYTSILKVAANRQRPNNSTNRLSFPSGHTSSSFASATAISMAYGWKAAIPAYAIAGVVAVSRLSGDVHWASDLAGGATLGIWMGYAYSSQISPTSKKKSAATLKKWNEFVFVPSVQNEAYFMNVLSQF